MVCPSGALPTAIPAAGGVMPVCAQAATIVLKIDYVKRTWKVQQL